MDRQPTRSCDEDLSTKSVFGRHVSGSAFNVHFSKSDVTTNSEGARERLSCQVHQRGACLRQVRLRAVLIWVYGNVVHKSTRFRRPLWNSSENGGSSDQPGRKRQRLNKDDLSATGLPDTVKPRCFSDGRAVQHSPLKNGKKTPWSTRQTIKNVYSYLSEICSNPASATAAAVGIWDWKTIYRLVGADRAPGENRTAIIRQRPDVLDSMDLSIIRSIVHGFLRNNTPPTLDMMPAAVKDNDIGLGQRFPYSRTKLYGVLRDLGFRFGRANFEGNLHIMFERADLIQ